MPAESPPTTLVAPSATPVDAAQQAAQQARSRRRRRRVAGSAGTYAALLIASVIVLFPIYVLVVDSLLKPIEFASNPPVFFPKDPQWSNYTKAFTQYGIGGYTLNSAIQTGIIVLAQLVTSILAAYAFAFLRFPLRRTLFLVVLATIMIPLEVTATVNLHTVEDLGWQSSFLGLTAPFLATGFGIFLMRQAFLSIPKELEEAAVIDGVGRMAFLWRVAIPLSRPVIAALAVFSFLGAWNQYLWPSLIESTGGPKTVQVGLAQIGDSAQLVGVSLAAAMLSLLPLVILLVFFRKNLIRSLTAGAVK